MEMMIAVADNPVLPKQTSDAALAAGGDTQAFERLYRGHVDQIFTLVRRMPGEDLADEVTQDVFVRAWQKLNTFRGDSAVGTWLHRLAITWPL